VHRPARQVLIAERDAPGVGAHKADDEAEGGGFAGPVRAEQADHFPAADLDIDAIDDGPAADAFD